MVACKLLGERLSPGRELLERRRATREAARLDADDGLPSELAEPGSLLAELAALNDGESQSHPIETRLYSSRSSLEAPARPEEELAWHDSTVVWSIGSAVHRTFSFQSHGPDGRVSQALFAAFPPVAPPLRPVASTSKVDPERERLFGPFAPPMPPPWTDELRFGETRPSRPMPEAKGPQRALCVFLQDILFVHFPSTGRDYYVHMPFKLHRAWSMQLGLLVERQPEPNEVGPAQLATLYSLTDPLDEFRVVATVPLYSSPAVPDHRAKPAVVPPSVSNIVGVADGEDEPKYLFTLDVEARRVTVWAYVRIPENETRWEASLTPVEEKREPRAKGKAKARSSLPPIPSSPAGGLPMDRVKSRSSMGPQGEPPTTTGMAKRMRDERRFSTRPTAEVSFAHGLDRMALGLDHDRDTTMLKHATAAEPAGEDQPMRSELFLAPIGECQLDTGDPILASAGDIEVILFDCRWPTALLAILSRKTNMMRIWRIDPTRISGAVQGSDRSLPARAIAPVLATRPDIHDLLVLEPSGQLSVTTADGYSLTVDAVPDRAIVDLTLAAADSVSLIDAEGRCTRASFAMSAETALVRQCLLAISCVVPTSAFLRLRVAHLDAARDIAVVQDDFSAFTSVVLAMLAQDGRGPGQAADDDWAALLAERQSFDSAFRHLRSPTAAQTVRSAPVAVTQPFTTVEAQAVLLALHLVAEDAKLVCSRIAEVTMLLPVLAQMAGTLGLVEWVDYYRRCGLTMAVDLSAPTSTSFTPPDLVTTLSAVLAGRLSPVYPDIRAIEGVTRSRFCGTAADPCPLSRQLIDLFSLFRLPEPAAAVVMQVYNNGWTVIDVEALSLGVRLPILEAMRQCQLKAPADWTRDGYELIGRDDLAKQAAVNEKTAPRRKILPTSRSVQPPTPSEAIDSLGPKPSGTPPIPSRKSGEASQFSQDMRLEEVARMLQSWRPVTIRMQERPELGEHAVASEQQALAVHTAARTLSLPIGSAMFTFRSEKRKPTEAIRVGHVVLTVKILPQGATLTVEGGAISGDKRHWPDFHAGVAAALRIALQPGALDLSDISFNKPDTLDARYAGFLMGLGLTGHIRTMASYQAFAYLDPKHELTSIGLLLGLSAAFASTCDPKATSVLSVHLSALHPSDSTTLNVTQATQAAGMLGLGLLYLGTKRRKLADVALRQLINTRVVPLEGPETCREAYTLACGFQYGMIMLQAGKKQPASASDADALRTLRGLVTGDGLHDLPSTKNSMSSATDVALTSPAATVALTLVYLDSGRVDVAESLEIPQSTVRFDYVRPDLILLRTLARALILRATIKPTSEWIESLVPAFVLKAKLMGRGGRSGSGDVDLAYWSIVAGACMAIGLRYAGTANAEAHATMIRYFDQVRRFAQFKDPTIQGRFLRKGVRSCVNVICLALATVMAGTGELHVLRRLRVLHGTVSDQSDFGSHLATHMALGLLFLGGGSYTLSTSPVATAALLCALYPAMPIHSGDNRAHIQAARHLWVLAVEPRRLIARDVDSGDTVFLPVKLRIREDGALRSQKLVTPTLIPELGEIESIRIDSPRYLEVRLQLASNAGHRSSFLKTRTLFVKRCGGYLSYSQDAKGVRSLFSRMKTDAGAAVFDFGHVAQATAAATMDELGNLLSFASEPAMRSAIDTLCGKSDAAPALESFMSSIVVEALTQDKPLAIALHVALLLARRTAEGGADVVAALAEQQLMMAIAFHAQGWSRPLTGSAFGKELVGPALVAHLDAMHRPPTLSTVASAVAVDYFRRGVWPSDELGRAKLAHFLRASRAPAVGVIGQLATLTGEAKAAGTSREEVEIVLRATLTQAMGVPAEEALLKSMVQAWLM